MSVVKWIFAFTILGLNSLHAKVIVLNATNFDRLTADNQGPVFVDVYAPWCSHCRQLEPVWEELSESLAGQVKVAKIDATEEQALRGRFFVNAFPQLSLLRDKETRIYTGPRSLEGLEEWALKGWRRTDPEPFYKAPNSGFGRYLGMLLGAPSKLHTFQQYLRVRWHFSELMIVLTFLAGPLLLGVAFIAFLDRMAVSSARREAQHEHQS